MNDSDPTDGDGFHNPASSTAERRFIDDCHETAEILRQEHRAMTSTAKSSAGLIIGRRVLSDIQTEWREEIRDIIAKASRCALPCACLRNPQHNDCARATDAILALISGEQAGQREQMTALRAPETD